MAYTYGTKLYTHRTIRKDTINVSRIKITAFFDHTLLTATHVIHLPAGYQKKPLNIKFVNFNRTQ